MKTLKSIFFMLTAASVVTLYVVVPGVVTLRSEFGGYLVPVAGSFLVVSAMAAGIVMILRKAAPPVAGSAESLVMPVLAAPGAAPAQPAGHFAADSRRAKVRPVGRHRSQSARRVSGRLRCVPEYT